MQSLAVVIVTYNSEQVITRLLDSLPAALADGTARVVVVDNGSTDRTRDILAARDDCEVVATTNGGYASGINKGVATTTDADAWLILNPDLTLEPRAVAPLLSALREPGVGIVGPKILDDEGVLQPSMRREPTLPRAMGLSFTRRAWLCEYVEDEKLYATTHDADWLLGAALMLSRRCLEETGHWDESYFLYSEETDFCLRARDRGWRSRYVPNSVVRHSGGGSGQSGRTHAMQILNRVRLYRRRHGLLPSFAYYVLTVISEVSWLGRGAVKSRASLMALLRPSRRPVELALAHGLIPA